MKLVGRKSALNPPHPHGPSTPRWFILLTVQRRWSRISLTFCCFVVYSTRRFVLSLASVILFLYFSVLLALRLPRLGKRELSLVLFICLFDLRFFFLFPLPLCVWDRLRLVIVALPGPLTLFCFIYSLHFNSYYLRLLLSQTEKYYGPL